MCIFITKWGKYAYSEKFALIKIGVINHPYFISGYKLFYNQEFMYNVSACSRLQIVEVDTRGKV